MSVKILLYVGRFLVSNSVHLWNSSVHREVLKGLHARRNSVRRRGLLGFQRLAVCLEGVLNEYTGDDDCISYA
jgi:hypothetical protein